MPKDPDAMGRAVAAAQGRSSGSMAGRPPASARAPRAGANDTQRQYLEWLSSQSYAQPQEAADGKYRGYATQSQLNDAVIGSAMQAQDSAFGTASELIGRGQRLSSDVNRATSQAEREARQAFERQQGDYSRRRGESYDVAQGMGASADRYSAMARQYLGTSKADQMGVRPKSGLSANVRDIQYIQALAPSFVAGQRGSTKDDYQRSVDEYLKSVSASAEPYLMQAANDEDLGRQIADTPLSDFAQMTATNQFGLDPMLARGLFGPEQLDIDAYKANRDLTSLEQTGMLPGEYEDYLAQQETQTRVAQTEADAAAEQQIADAVTERTGFDADQLAQSTDLDVTGLANVITSEMYSQYDAALRQAAATNDQRALEETLASAATQDPTVYRVLRRVWGEYTGDGFVPTAANTWQSSRDAYAEAIAAMNNQGG